MRCPAPPRRRLMPLLAAVGIAATPSAAAGQTPLTISPCASPKGFECGTLTVPLDRANPAAGTLALRVRRLPAKGAYRGTIVFLAGGPGQSAIRPDGELERTLRDAGPGYEVVTFDERGTGANALRCPTLEASDGADDALGVAAQVATCAAEIGPPRRNHTTGDTVADIEDLRLATGRERLTLFGVSYGTLVATWYARVHAPATAGLILDSVVGLQGNGALDPDGYAAARRALAELCRGARCRAVTRDPLGDVARLEARLAAAPLRGRRVDARGRPRPAEFGGPDSPTQLFETFGNGDLSPEARGAFPAAVTMALRGDPALLFRAAQADSGPDRPQDFSLALFFATACGESHLPWNPAQPAADRLASATAALAASDPSVTAPFARPGVDSALVLSCAGWPDAPFTAPPATPLPDVPALLLAGTQDIRTPYETASTVAAGLPRASLVRAAGSGHSSISARGGCAVLAIRRFLRGSGVGQPCAEPELPDIAPLPPASLAALRPLGPSGRRGRTVRAAVATFQDISQALSFGTSGAGGGVRFTGLRAGTGTAAFTGGGLVVRFTGYEYVPGVRVTGTVRLRDGRPVARLAVSGPAAVPGRLLLDGPRITGTLAGRRVDVRR